MFTSTCEHPISSYFPPSASGQRTCSECEAVADYTHVDAPAADVVDVPVSVDPMLVVGTEIGALRSHVSWLESSVSSLNARVDGLQASVSGLSTRVGDLSSLSADVAALKAVEDARVQHATETALAGTTDAKPA